ncbi:urease accessory protein UreE [Comamonas sp. Z1]|nr:urease accessory protein UreE [Cupriavidus sp.]MCA3192168.1 urease accessory protein UreE [Cupriavidus sp.]MCA3234593.1 urease accessory protein UreE [Cupriavidus sp.]QWE98091.1 hypothetical protein KLP38_29890 [Cupriavidus sp. EM10]TYK71163.1 urease accessory protein UreE [Comamonas sp. Z1]
MIEQHFDPPIAARILGRVGAPEFAGRWIERVPVPAADAARRRVLLRGEHGTAIAVDLPKPAWLFDGAVLHDNGCRLLVVTRPPEPVMVIGLAQLTPADTLRIGHALGNRHSPCELSEGEIIVPVTDTPELASRPVLALGLAGLQLRFDHLPFAAQCPPACGAAAHDHPPQRLDHGSHLHPHSTHARHDG